MKFHIISMGRGTKIKSPLVEIYRPNQDVETLYFSEQTPPTLSGETVLPGFLLDLTPLFNLR
ncbi:MAG: hypothetical protein C4323_04995 [Mastigocladus sp. ERB_26_2]